MKRICPSCKQSDLNTLALFSGKIRCSNPRCRARFSHTVFQAFGLAALASCWLIVSVIVGVFSRSWLVFGSVLVVAPILIEWAVFQFGELKHLDSNPAPIEVSSDTDL